MEHPCTAKRRLELISRGACEEGTECARARGLAQLAERFGFDLADTLTGEGKRLAHFPKRVLTAVLQPEAHLDDLFLARRECLEHRGGLFFEVQVDDRVGGREDGLVFDEVAQM